MWHSDRETARKTRTFNNTCTDQQHCPIATRQYFLSLMIRLTHVGGSPGSIYCLVATKTMLLVSACVADLALSLSYALFSCPAVNIENRVIHTHYCHRISYKIELYQKQFYSSIIVAVHREMFHLLCFLINDA